MRQYQTITDRLVAMLEAGVRPWQQPWAAAPGGGRPRRVDGTPYRGINTVALWMAAQERGFASPFWMTFKGAKDRGAHVRKGAKAELAFFVGTIQVTDEIGGEDVERDVRFLKSYCVFNADEVEGLPSHFYRRAERSTLSETERCAVADAFIGHTGAQVVHGGGRAFYRRATDEIHMPEFGAFTSGEGYYGVLLHELAHWTGHASRLDRLPARIVHGDAAYAGEELVAEMTAAFLSADLGVSAEPREDHASYLAEWIAALKADNRVIFRAAAAAEKAAGYLHGLQPAALAAAA